MVVNCVVSVSLFTNVHYLSKIGNMTLKFQIIAPAELVLCGHMPGAEAKKRRLPLNENKLQRSQGSDRLPLTGDFVRQVRFLYWLPPGLSVTTRVIQSIQQTMNSATATGIREGNEGKERIRILHFSSRSLWYNRYKLDQQNTQSLMFQFIALLHISGHTGLSLWTAAAKKQSPGHTTIFNILSCG
jgi:hypothetical protein